MTSDHGTLKMRDKSLGAGLMSKGQSKDDNQTGKTALTTLHPSEGTIHQWDEHEIKFHIPAHFAIPDQLGIPLSPRVFTSTYFDSQHHRLGKLGLTLRKRVERGRGVWQLKIPSGGCRIELAIESGSRHIPWQFLDLLTAFFRKHEPVQLGKLRTWRTGRLIQEKKFSAELILDSVALLQENKIIARFQELELELKTGQPKHLKPIRTIVEKAGASAKSLQPKIFQALHLSYPLVLPAPDAKAPPSDHIQARLQEQITQMVLHDPGTRLGRDSEALHQMRVATRRIRALLRSARGFLDPQWGKLIRKEVGWIGSRLGEVRDWDVFLESLHQESTGMHSPQEEQAFQLILNAFQEERSMARARLLEELRSDRYLDLLDTLENSLTHLPFQSDPPSMVDVVRQAFCKLEKFVDSTQGQFPKQDLHRTRILVKRARYTVELAQPLLHKRAKCFLQKAKCLQDLLGEHQDALVAENHLISQNLNTRNSEVAFVKGILVERFRHRQHAACQDLSKHWNKLRNIGNKL